MKVKKLLHLPLLSISVYLLIYASVSAQPITGSGNTSLKISNVKANSLAGDRSDTCGVFTFDTFWENPICQNSCDGIISISNLSGGTPGYSFLWGATNSVSDSLGSAIFYVCAGNYNVTITDSVGNTCTAQFTMVDPPALTVFADKQNTSCFDVCDGKVYCVGGNFSIHTYSWSPVYTNTPYIFNVCAGTYILAAMDIRGCPAFDTVVVSEPLPIQVNEVVSNASCNGCCDGNISLTPANGVAPYIFTFTPSSSLPNEFCSGIYNYCVTDSTGCFSCDTVLVTFPSSIGSNELASAFTVFQNLSSGEIDVQMNQYKNVQLNIFNILGECILKQIFSSSNQHFDLSDQPNGIYFFYIITSEGVFSKKIIISR